MTRKRQRRKKLFSPEPIERLLERTDDPTFSKFRAPITPRQWKQVVGEHVATRTQPIRLENGQLLVRAATSSWAHELSLLTETILAKLASLGFQVKEIRFRVGVIDPPVRPPPERLVVRRIPPGADLPEELASELAKLDDDELRASIDAAARRSIALIAALRDAPNPRGAGRESARPDRTSTAAAGAAPRIPGGGRDRSR